MSTSKANPKVKIQRLRASCDGCFLAKVKCSKARPICSRCLTCGTDCKYSPSSRAGKPKSSRPGYKSNLAINVNNSNHGLVDSAMSSPFLFEAQSTGVSSNAQEIPTMFGSHWLMPRATTTENYQATTFASVLPPTYNSSLFAPPNMDFASSTADIDSMAALMSVYQNDMDNSMYGVEQGMSLQRSRSTGDVHQVNAYHPWFEDQRRGSNFSPPTTSSTMTPDVFVTPGMSPDSPPKFSKSIVSTCNCFTTCLQSLQALHNQSSAALTGPAFDGLLSINKKALDCCAGMLACSNCSSRFGLFGSNTNAMILTTIVEKVLSFYQAAAQELLNAKLGHDLKSGGGASHTNKVDVSTNLEILWRDMSRLDEVLSHFKEVLGTRDDTGVYFSLLSHLNQTLSFTYEMFKFR